MKKMALLIGVSEYGPGWPMLPNAVQDMEAMQRVLLNPDIGNFDDVKSLPNPEPTPMQEAIETLFATRDKDDLVLLFFSGHGVRDEAGKLYLSTRASKKSERGELVKSTAVPASFVQDIMTNSHSKRQVVILDCCFSGAFAEGLSAKDGGVVDVRSQLGGEGRAVLTSSTSTQYSFEQKESPMSIYTRYFVEGLETGVADQDEDGEISVEELHEYTRRKVQEEAPAMNPEIYVVKEGYTIRLAKAPMTDPSKKYRKEVERMARRGDLLPVNRRSLDTLQQKWQLNPEDAEAIEREVFEPREEYKRKLLDYEDTFEKTLTAENPLSSDTRDDLRHYQEILGLRDEDVSPIETRVEARINAQTKVIITDPLPPEPKPAKPDRGTTSVQPPIDPSGKIEPDKSATDDKVEQPTPANDSGMGKASVLPKELKGFNWGAFLLSGIWAIAHKTWIGLLAFIPFVGFLIAFVLGVNGNEWAWQNRKWKSIEEFKKVQKVWMYWGIAIVGLVVILWMLMRG
jgi:hypothetical protein